MDRKSKNSEDVERFPVRIGNVAPTNSWHPDTRTHQSASSNDERDRLDSLHRQCCSSYWLTLFISDESRDRPLVPDSPFSFVRSQHGFSWRLMLLEIDSPIAEQAAALKLDPAVTRKVFSGS